MDNGISDVQKSAIEHVLSKGKKCENLVRKAIKHSSGGRKAASLKDLSFSEAIKVIRYINSNASSIVK